MLKAWQIKFPYSFAPFSTLFTHLDVEEQEALSQLLHFLERAGLLDEETVTQLFNHSSHLSELIYLISLINSAQCLNKSTLNHLFAHHFPDLQESMELLSQQTNISADAVTFLCVTRNPKYSAAFIVRALKEGGDLAVIVNYLSQQVALDGLNRAIALFDLSSFRYKQEHFPAFRVLMRIFENPLCQTIFDARLRNFSGYTLISEPLSSMDADEVIKRLVDAVEEEAKVRLFFDFFASFRPFPPSQKDIVDVSVSAKVTHVLMNHCKTTIAAIASRQDSLRAQEMVTTLRKSGGNKLIFDQIKYEIASDIESEDLCATRSYDELMDEIWSALSQPQVNLQPLEDQVHAGWRNSGFFAEALNSQSSDKASLASIQQHFLG